MIAIHVINGVNKKIHTDWSGALRGWNTSMILQDLCKD